MDRMNSTISETITSSITSISFAKIRMIPGLPPLQDLDIRSYIPDQIQPLILLSYPMKNVSQCTIAHGKSCTGAAAVARNAGNAAGYWGSTIEKRLGNPTSLLGRSKLFSKSPTGAKLASLVPQIPLLEKLFGSTWRNTANRSLTTTSSSGMERVYGKGPKDALFVLFWAVAFTVLRELLMRWVYEPLMRRRLKQLDKAADKKTANGTCEKVQPNKQTKETAQSAKRDARIREKTVTRFAEQGWMFTYCVTFFSLGVVSCLVCLIYSVSGTNGFRETVHSLPSRQVAVLICLPMAGLPTYASLKAYEILLSRSTQFLVSPTFRHSR